MLSGCLEPFDPKVPDTVNGFIVIDGVITDQSGPYQVTISKSTSLSGESELVTGITDILIESQSGESENLEELVNGTYQTDLLQGEERESYRLSFTYENRQYQSSWETILPSPPIDNISFQEETRATTSLSVDLDGLQFFVHNQSLSEESQYFRYEWEETWQFEAPTPVLFDYLGGDSITLILDPPIHECWKQVKSSGINIATTENLTENILSGHPLGFMSGDQRFSLRYSLLVKQFTIDEKEHTFWESLKESNEESGSLFDRQPAKASSNITNIDDSGETVLGYFSASGYREKRIFIDNLEVSAALRAGSICLDVEVLLKTDLDARYEETLLQKLEEDLLFFDFIFQMDFPVPIGAVLVAPVCADCTLRGGVLQEPEFWNE